ncbi:MAG: hypothetical protein V1823_05690 [Chloroflexota bacterium]
MKSPLKLVSTLVMVALLATTILACGGTQTLPVETPPTPPAETPPITTPTTAQNGTPPAETPAPPPTTAENGTPPAPQYSYEAEIFGEKINIATDSRGAMLEPFERTSPDGVVTIKFEAGTKITGSNFAPVKTLSAKINSNPVQPADGPKIIGPTVTFLPNSASIYPPMTYQFNYAGFETQIAEVPNAQLVLGFLLSTGSWATFFDSQVDTTNKVATVKIVSFTTDYTVALLAQTPKEIVKATEGPKNGIDASIVSISELGASETAKLTIKTVPNARVMIWVVQPQTNTRSTRPSDRIKIADAEGIVTWEWTLHYQVARGEGRIEIYVTTSTDTAFLTAFNNNTLNTLFPDRATDIENFKKGLIELLELDDHTTLKMFTITVVRGL